MSPESECLDEQVEDFRSLLSSARVVPPYVLVGHSGGGIRIRRFTRDHPDEVAGLVFVDSAHEEQLWDFWQSIHDRYKGPLLIRTVRDVAACCDLLGSVWFGTTISR